MESSQCILNFASILLGMYPSLTFFDFHLPCFLKSLSLTPKFSTAVAHPACRLCKSNNLVSAPIFLSPSITFSLSQV